jgi:ABC-2 type transport system ATP-binding protein
VSANPLAIETEGLVKCFGETRAVDGIDLAVQAGTVYGVLGPNGAGKTTTIRVLATLLRPTAGRARVLGHDVVDEADAVRGSVSLTGQFASVDEELSGKENLVLLGKLLGLDRRAAQGRADELLTAFGLAEAAGKLVSQYSGGMRRRLDIAASIVVTPELLFLDEPTTGLDPRSRNQVWDIVRVLVSEGTTVLLTTQYLEEADQLAGRVAVIDGGHVIANDEPSRLKAQMGDTVVEMSFPDEGFAERAVGLLGGDSLGKVEREHRTVRVSSNKGARVLVEVLRRFDADGVEPSTLTVREPSLDDVFLELTGHRAEASEPDQPAEGGAA